MTKKQIAHLTSEILLARLNYLEAVGSGAHFRDMAEYDAIQEELDTRSNAILDDLSKEGV